VAGTTPATEPEHGNPVLVGINTDFPPYEYLDASGDPQGFDVELLRSAAQATGLDIRFQPGPWDRIRGDLEARRIDMLAGMLRSKERERYADFSSPCLVVLYGIFVRTDTSDIRTLEALRGRRILVENGSQMHEFLKSQGFAKEIMPVESEPAALKALASGTGDAALVPLLTGAMQMRDSKLTNVRRVGDSIYSRELCFSVAKGNQDLLERLNTGLAILNQTGEYSRIYQKWFGGLDQQEATLLFLLKRILWFLVPLALLAAAILAWMWILRRQVHQRTRELRQVNRTLREKERFLQAIVDNLPVAVFGKDPNRGFAYTVWNKRCETMLNRKAEAILGLTDHDLSSREEADFFHRSDEQAFAQRGLVDIPNDYTSSFTKDTILLHTVKVPIFDEEGRPWMLLVLSEDVTLKRKTEAELLRSQARLAEAQRIAHLGSWEWDILQGEAHWSDEIYRILGLEPRNAQLSLGALLRFSHPGDRGRAILFLKRAARHGHAASLNHRILLPGGNVRHLHTTIEARVDEDGKIRSLFGTSQDVTERRNAEEALRQAQKLEGLGVLAGGIAHDFNNLLTAIMANLNLAQMTIPVEAKTAHYLKNIETTVVRAADLTRQMLAYSGRGTFVIQSLDMNQVAEEITQLLKASIPKKIAIRFALQPGLPRIDADIAQLQQVLMNLVTNASEAIGEQEGTLTIRTGTAELDLNQIAGDFPGQEMTPGCFVLLEVTDTGCGMAPETRERLFEPFYTTKFSGRGLGLSALRGILKGHHAGIRLESEVGKGSVFRLYFPSGSQPIAAPPRLPEGAAASRLQPGTVLLVDDEPAVLSSTTAMLNELGYQVIEAEDGLLALDLYRQQGAEISLVLLDLTMPRMNGHETLRELRKINPDVKVILCSGYHEQEALQETRLGDLVAFLHKPFRLQDLRTALTRLPS
jgi:two-component system, cell cycle sensor histidine kinase and response regulator CckA